MVLTQRSSQSSVSAKKQQSISNFFSKSPSTSCAVSSPPLCLPVHQAPFTSIETSIGDDENSALPVDNPSECPKNPASRTPKRTSDELYHEKSQEGLPARKRPRIAGTESDRLTDSHETQSSNQNDRPVGPKEASLPNHQNRKLKTHKRTSKYTFSSSPTHDDVETQVDDEETRQEKEILHKKFVKKLGRPDSIAEIKRRQWQETGEPAHDQVDPDDEGSSEEAPSAKPSAKGKKGAAGRKKGAKLTPLEEQYLDIKRKNLDAILIVEVGYKFKFFGEDSRIAAKELGIMCIPGKFRYDEHASEAHLDRFATASVPVHRLHVHVKRLVDAGHKVGVVRQIETAALKAAGDNRNAPFTRELTNMYTKGTYIDDIDGLEAPSDASSTTPAVAAGYLLCITENNANGWGTDEKVRVGILAVQPATGDIIYDDFEDGFMRSEIETRLLHIGPCEILVVGSLSKATEKLVQHLSGSKTNVFGDKIRVERVEKPKTMVAQAYSHVSNFYAGKMTASTRENDEVASKLLGNVLKLAEDVTVCLSAMITHMSEYGLEHVFHLTKYFQSFSARSHMLLNGNTLTSLEIYQNQTDHSEKGSLFWTLNRTKTRFGQRLLRKWVGRPLLIKAELEERIAAVEELKNEERTMKVDKIKHSLSQIRIDLEKSLIRIYYGKCTRAELLGLLQTLQKISSEFLSVKSPTDAGFHSSALNDAIATLPLIYDDVVAYLNKINAQAAKKEDKYSFFMEEAESDEIESFKLGIAAVEADLESYRPAAAAVIKKKKVEYVTVAAIEYLIEVDNNQLKHVPASWAKISGTKKLSRFHPPEITRLIRERDENKEKLAAACDDAYRALLTDIAAKYQPFRDCIQGLATLDCLLSLVSVANQPEYVKPEYTDSPCIAIEQGRHPMVEQLLLDTYVPNDVDLKGDETRALLITGPNMGGKSSYVRQIALIAIMGQIGSYVPASSAKLGMLDAVFTRMGAFDNMMAGESTFMVELSETSDILKQATPRSLIILDELGRGTSTHDGVAIAQSVLDHVVRNIQSLTLFITHYQNLSSVAKGFSNNELKNVHVKFQEGGENGEEITFLYEVGDGVAHRSYGLNVARLANIPDSVLQLASVKSKALEELAMEKNLGYLSQCFSSMLEKSSEDELDQVVVGIEQL